MPSSSLSPRVALALSQRAAAHQFVVMRIVRRHFAEHGAKPHKHWNLVSRKYETEPTKIPVE